MRFRPGGNIAGNCAETDAYELNRNFLLFLELLFCCHKMELRIVIAHLGKDVILCAY